MKKISVNTDRTECREGKTLAFVTIKVIKMATINITIIFALQSPLKRSIFRIMIQVSILHTAKKESKCLLASFTPM